MSNRARNELAKQLKSLHVPSKPLVLTNVWDGATAFAAAQHPTTRAIATTSYAVAEAAGFPDAELTQETNEAGIATVARGIARAGASDRLPLTVDLQDGYADPASTIKRVIAAGAVGCNLEDLDSATGKLRPQNEHVARIKTVLQAAKEVGVPDFCVNARTDVLDYPDTGVQDAVTRAKAYLEAGATTVLVWGGGRGRGLRDAEVKVLAKELGGRVNVLMVAKKDPLGVKELAEIGVARISVGPKLFHAAMKGYRDAMEEILPS